MPGFLPKSWLALHGLPRTEVGMPTREDAVLYVPLKLVQLSRDFRGATTEQQEHK